MANVYVFNLSENPIIMLNINNKPATTVVSGTATPISATNPIGGWGAGEPYQPVGISVPRSPYPSNLNPNAAFSQAGPPNPANEVSVIWGNSAQSFQFNIQMKGQNDPLNEDYLLYIATSQAILFDEFGTSIFTIPNPAAAAAAAAFAQQVAMVSLNSSSSKASSKASKKSSQASKASKKSSQKKGGSAK
jgi:hypothetical protein